MNVKVLWDWIVAKADYINDYDENDGQEAKNLPGLRDYYTVFMNCSQKYDKEGIAYPGLINCVTVTVCVGYAKAYAMLLNEAGIETYVVNLLNRNGDNHSINLIKFDKGYSYADPTTESYRYLIKSQEQYFSDIKKYTGNGFAD